MSDTEKKPVMVEGDEETGKEAQATNFIHTIIEKDLEEQTYGDRVYTRFPPEPNGYLHIGHAKSICLNFSTAAKYGGKCNLRYDDTNPVKEDVEYVDSIEEDVKWLGFQWDKRLWASDYFDKMYQAENIKPGRKYCGPKLIWHRRTSICAIRFSIALLTRPTIIQGTNGVFIQCMTLRTR